MSSSVVIPKSAASYLSAVGACAVFIRPTLRVGAARVRELPRGGLIWITWTQEIEAAKAVACAIQDQSDNVTLIDIIAAIEQRARETGIILTEHAKAIERADYLAQRVHQALDDFRRSGKLGMFNKAYQVYRARSNGHALPYGTVLNQMRFELIRVLADADPRDPWTPAAMLNRRLREKYQWYAVWFQ
jgi:hypothetical protein